jgi:hypothetical protein
MPVYATNDCTTAAVLPGRNGSHAKAVNSNSGKMIA